MKFNPAIVISKLLDNKKFLAVFSLVIAIVFWLVIEIAENPSRDVTVTDVPVILVEQKDDNGNSLNPIGNYVDKVTVTVTGPGYIVGTIGKEDITISVKPEKPIVEAGDYILRLSASVNADDCKAVVNFESIKVYYDYQKDVNVAITVDDSDFKKFETTDSKVKRSILKNNFDGTELTTLTVSGPSKEVDKIARVDVRPDLSTLNTNNLTFMTTTFESIVEFYDAAGKKLDSSLFKYNTDTSVRCVVHKTASVKLRPTFTNLPSYFTQNSSELKYSLSAYNEISGKYDAVTEINLEGPVDVINRLVETGLELEPIDFANVRPGKTSFNIALSLPDEVVNVDMVENIRVSLNLGAISVKTVEIDPSDIKFVGLDQKFTASTSYAKKIKIQICGISSAINAVNTNNISVSVDCTAITTATVETKPLVVAVSINAKAWAVSIEPVEISITVK